MDGTITIQDESVLCGSCIHCGEGVSECHASPDSKVLYCPDYERKLSYIFNSFGLCETCANKLTCILDKPKTLCKDYITDCGDACALNLEEKDDNVNHPSHYTQGGIECIKAIEASMTSEGFQDYCKGNVLKYIWRWKEKGGTEDLHKALVYLTWLIESAEKGCIS